MKDIIGLVMNNNKDDFLVNNVLLLGKLYIHKSKYLKMKPTFCAVYKEFISFTKALKVMKKKKYFKSFVLYRRILFTGKTIAPFYVYLIYIYLYFFMHLFCIS